MCGPRAEGSRRAKVTRPHRRGSIPSTDTRASGTREDWMERGPCSENETSWGDDLDLFWRRHCHMELRAGNAFNEGMSRPGTLLELQLTPFDFEVVPAGVQSLELD